MEAMKVKSRDEGSEERALDVRPPPLETIGLNFG